MIASMINDPALISLFKRSRSDEILMLSRMFIGKPIPLSEIVISDILGSGSNGIVFKCQYTPNINQSTLIAVKLLFNFGISTSKLQSRFENEYLLLKEVPPHNNIVQLLTTFTDKPTTEMISKMHPDTQQLVQRENFVTKEKRIRQTMFVVFEYHPINMQEYMRQNSLGVREILNFCSQISSALNFLFNHRIVHRDIKMDNILISSDNSPILCDFGMAIRIDERCLGRVDVPGGNSNHVAPEVANEFFHRSKSSAEVFYVINYTKQPSWELGVICYEIAVGDHPFGDYPIGCGDVPNLHVNKLDVSILKILNFPHLFIDTLVALVEDAPEKRIPIFSACASLDACLKDLK